MIFKIESLNDTHHRSGFRCGDIALDRYFQEQVTQDIKRRVATCFVVLEKDNGIVGFYTLASASIPVKDLPQETAKKLPRYPVVPSIRIGRLAVAEDSQGQGIGGIILLDAMRRALKSEAGTFALLVDAKNEKAVSFYAHHGFIRFESAPRTLFLPLATAEKVLRSLDDLM